jgi:hypothetical protein
MKTPYYKYRPLYIQKDDGSRGVHPFTESIFKKAEIYYGAPTDFNDPFDCNLKIGVNDSTDLEWEGYIDELIVARPDKRSELLQIRNAKLWRSNPHIFGDIGENQRKIHYVDSSVYCLAKKANSIPMFAYYADGHSGIAIQFAFSDREVPCGFNFNPVTPGGQIYDGKIIFRDVEYPPTFPELNYHRIRNTDKLVRHLIFSKSQEWEHEEEFRIFRRNIAKSSVSFDRALITKVIFGCKTTRADVDLVKGWLRNWPADVILSKAEPATDRFELVIRDFDLVRGH